MNATEALTKLKHGYVLYCTARAGVYFQIQPKISDGLLWLRTRPTRRGCLNRYSRLPDDEIVKWLETVRVIGTGKPQDTPDVAKAESEAENVATGLRSAGIGH